MVKNRSIAVSIILSLVTCGFYSWYWLYKSGEKVDYLKQANGETPASSAIVYLLLGIFGLGIISYALIQDEINKNAEQVI